jgi:energy-coupling factor transporter ATP-binding protein EcfA2
MLAFDEATKRNQAEDFRRALPTPDLEKAALQIVDYFRMPEHHRTLTTPRIDFDIAPYLIASLATVSNQRCAFCEKKIPGGLHAHRFRPIFGASDPRFDHSNDLYSYFWLAVSVRNLFPICSGCIPSHRQHFPVFKDIENPWRKSFRASVPQAIQNFRDNQIDLWQALENPNFDEEKPVLLYPGEVIKPGDFFDLNVHGDQMFLSARAGLNDTDLERVTATIDHFNLNRTDLAEDRGKAVTAFFGELKTGELNEDLKQREFGGFLSLLSLKILLASSEDARAYFETTNFPRNTSFIEQCQTRLQNWLTYGRPDAAELEDVLARVLEPGQDSQEEAVATIPETPLETEPVAVDRDASPTEPMTSPADEIRSRGGRFLLPKSLNVKNFRPIQSLGADGDGIDLDPLKHAESGASFSKIDSETPKAGQVRAGALMFLGENGCGKTSILEAIALCLLGESPEPTKKVDGEEIIVPLAEQLILDPSYILCRQEELPEETSVSFEFLVQNSSAANPEVFTSAIQVERRPSEHRNVDYGTTGSKIEAVTADVRTNATDGAIVKTSAMPAVMAYGPNRVFGKAPKEEDGTGKIHWQERIKSLFDADAPLRNPSDALVSLKRRSVTETGALNAYKKLCAILTEILDFHGTIDGFETKSCSDGGERICVRIAPPNSENYDGRMPSMPLESLSSGFQSVVAIICDMFVTLFNNARYQTVSGTSSNYNAHLEPAVVIIDEIEAHLHPRWKLSVVSKLRESFPNVFFIFSTHDPLCLRGMEPGQVFCVSRHYHWDQNEPQETVEVVPFKGVPEQLTVDQLLTSDLFDLYSTDDPNLQRRLYESVQKGDEHEEHWNDLSEKEIRTALPMLNRFAAQELAVTLKQYLCPSPLKLGH